MKITLRFEAQLREAAGRDEAVIVVQDGSFQSVLDALAEEFPESVSKRILGPDGLPLRSVLIFVNDQSLMHDNVESYVLQEGDVIAFYPPIAGG